MSMIFVRILIEFVNISSAVILEGFVRILIGFVMILIEIVKILVGCVRN